MKLRVTVKPNSRKVGIERSSEDEWIVRVREPALEGKANKAVVAAVAAELSIPKSRVKLLRGEKSRHKILQID